MSTISMKCLNLLCSSLMLISFLPVFGEVKLKDAGENAAWEKIRSRFNGKTEVRKNSKGKPWQVKVYGFKDDKKGGGWARISIGDNGRVFEVSSDRAGFTNEEFKIFVAFKELEKLTLWHNSNFHDKKAPIENYGGAGLVHLKSLKKLSRVTLAGGGIDDEGLKAAAELPNLKYIGMWHVVATDEGFSYFRGNKTIEELRLGPFWAKQLTDKTLDHLSECPNLKVLKFGETYLTYEGMKNLVKIKDSLKELDLENSVVSPEDVEKIKKDLPNTKVKWRGLASAGKVFKESGWHLGKAKKWMPKKLIEEAIKQVESPK